MNVDVLEQAIADIQLHEYVGFDMGAWAAYSGGELCSTTCCIGGHVVLRELIRQGYTQADAWKKIHDPHTCGNTDREARELLGLPEAGLCHTPLFYQAYWPIYYKCLAASTADKAAALMKDMINGTVVYDPILDRLPWWEQFAINRERETS